jgi:hypothetical protein
VDNALTVYWPGGGRRELARAHKSVVAAGLVALIAERHALALAGAAAPSAPLEARALR